MNIKTGGAAVIGAAVIIISISGCAGVRGQVEQGSGAASITSLQTQQDTARREAALQRAASHGVPQQAATSLKAQQDTARAESAQERAARTENGQRAVSQSFDSSTFDAVGLQQQAIRERLEARATTSVSIQELMRQQKQSETVGEGDAPSAADMQGQRLAQYAEQVAAHEEETTVPTPSPRPISPRNR